MPGGGGGVAPRGVPLSRSRCGKPTFAETAVNGEVAPKDETALAVIGGKTRGLGSSEKQASCLEIEGPRTSLKTGAPNDREGHQSVTPAVDRGHGDPPA